jgi:predicted amidohydrolase
LKPDTEADISILKLVEGDFKFLDADNGSIKSNNCLKASGVVKAGVYRSLE